jgi:hypothetical protein
VGVRCPHRRKRERRRMQGKKQELVMLRVIVPMDLH